MNRNRLTPIRNNPNDAAAHAYYKELEVDTLARTIWGEARGEGSHGMEAVAAVVMNRVAIARDKGGYWWGASPIQVCQKPYQFSCWNRSDPNFRRVVDVKDDDLHFATALRIARRALAGALADPTEGATHYHAAGADPYWAKNEKPVAVIGRHIFYRPTGTE
ncbi:MAG: cell wall hydrolase [Alphaproteobacteria bacterium]|nr:cell wall hydrolase [Alphaproteobacteria bacterium]